MMAKKENKNVMGIEKVEKKDTSFRKELETYLVFGLVVLFVGIFIGTTASAISIYRSKNSDPVDLDTTKMIESATPEDEDVVTTDDLDLDELEQVEGAVQDPSNEYIPIYPE
jgi:hypothetical protein